VQVDVMYGFARDFLSVCYTANYRKQQAVHQANKNERKQPYIMLTDTFYFTIHYCN